MYSMHIENKVRKIEGQNGNTKKQNIKKISQTAKVKVI